MEVLDMVQDFLTNCGRQEQKSAALLCRAYWSAFCIVVCRQKATRIHPFDKILSNTPAARNAIKCQLSVPGLTTHTHTDFLCLAHLKTLLEGLTKEEQGSSQSRGSEPAFSLMTFTENIMGGNREGTEWPAGYSSARIHAFAAWLVHDGLMANRDEWSPPLWKTRHVSSSWLCRRLEARLRIWRGNIC